MKKLQNNDIRSFFDRSKDVSNRSAQITKLLQPKYELMTPFFVNCQAYINDVTHYYLLRMFLDLLVHSGARVSEILQIRGTDINITGSIILHAKKGSTNRMIAPTITAPYFSNFFGNPTQIFGEFNRFYIYRLMKQNGMFFYNESGQNAKVTHACRHHYINSIQQITLDLSSTAILVGHKNQNSTKFYVKKDGKNSDYQKK